MSDIVSGIFGGGKRQQLPQPIEVKPQPVTVPPRAEDPSRNRRRNRRRSLATQFGIKAPNIKEEKLGT